jgi:outer membrane biosynthesis protein TonB
MRRVFGPRTIVEAAFLVAVPVVALVAGLSAYAIVAASAVAYLLVLAVEAIIWREGTAGSRKRPKAEAQAPAPEAKPAPAPVAAAAAAEPGGEHVRVLPREEPPPPVVEAEPEPEPVVEPEPEPEPERPPLVVVPEPEPEPVLEPEPEPELAPEPAPVVAAVVPIGVGAGPRQWNVWDLERLAREHAGTDAARDEERTFLLMYLRDYADAGGELPLDFDGLVRDSFGDLVGR